MKSVFNQGRELFSSALKEFLLVGAESLLVSNIGIFQEPQVVKGVS